MVWNEFQFFHVKSILDRDPAINLVIEGRPGFWRRFPKSLLAGLRNRVLFCPQAKLSRLDDELDVLVVQSNTVAKTALKRCKVVGLQYSLSKEWHQYGEWLSGADLALCFGEYSRQKLENGSPVEVVGNPRLDGFFAGRLDNRILTDLRTSLTPGKPVLMFAPSWNDAGAVRQLQSARASLSAEFNVLWSPHHVTRIFGNKIGKLFGRGSVDHDSFVHFLSVADVLVSDTSGALFDAIHVEKPVIIFDPEPGRSHPSSIEFDQRDRIGPVASNANQISALAKAIQSGEISFTDANAGLRRECFHCSGGAADNILAAIRRRFS
jgi:Putative glycosyl/glycerophosphate transferases involved in teichoic acid biosynthesis TagF/TagB/EpsJ/RodC